MNLHAATLCVEEIGPAEIRKSLRTQREALKLSQLALAKRSGVPASNINRIEDGKQEITPRTFARLMTAMEKRAKELHAEIEELRGIQVARQRVAICKALPFLRQRLPQAQAELAKLENETQNNKTIVSALESPVVRGLLAKKGVRGNGRYFRADRRDLHASRYQGFCRGRRNYPSSL